VKAKIPVSNRSDEETDEPLIANDRDNYKIEKWTKDGSKLERMLYGGSNLDKAREDRFYSRFLLRRVSAMTKCTLYFLAFVGCAVASVHYDAVAFPTVTSGQIAPKEHGFSHAVKSKKCKEDQEKNGSPCCADNPPPYCR